MEYQAVLENPVTWVAVSFAIVVGAIAKFVAPLIVKALDQRASDVSDELARAIALREEAEATLAKYKKKQEEALLEAEELIQRANLEARRITKEAEQQAEASLEKRTRMAIDKISQAENNAVKEVRERVINVAVVAAKEILKSEVSKKSNDDMLQKTTDEITRQLH